jgi:group I intron endonuclease
MYNDPKKQHYHVYNWIRQQLSIGFTPTIHVIEVCSLESVYEREVYWIKKYRDDGFDLTNKVEGGPGMLGLKHTQETKDLMSQRLKGKKSSKRWQEMVKNQVGEKHPMYGKKHSPETIVKLKESHVGYVMPQEQKDKIRASLKGVKKGPFGPEHIEKLRKAAEDKSHPVIINGIQYTSIREAARKTGIGRKRLARDFTLHAKILGDK